MEYGNWPKCGWKQGDSVWICIYCAAMQCRPEIKKIQGFELTPCGVICRRRTWTRHTQALGKVWQVTVTRWQLPAQLAFDSATVSKRSSSKKPMGEMSENVRLLGTVWPVVSCYFFIYSTGMLVSPILSIRIMIPQSPPDVTSLHFTHISACVQVVYCWQITNFLIFVTLF